MKTDEPRKPASGDAAATNRKARPRTPYLGRHHPLAEVVARLCAEHLGAARTSGLGGVGCGACWESAIRDDEAVVVLFGLPRKIEPDPSLVDEVAVERALAGEDVALTRVERAVVKRRKREARRKVAEVKDRGWLSPAAARRGRRSPVDFKGRLKAPIPAALVVEDVAA